MGLERLHRDYSSGNRCSKWAWTLHVEARSRKTGSRRAWAWAIRAPLAFRYPTIDALAEHLRRLMSAAAAGTGRPGGRRRRRPASHPGTSCSTVERCLAGRDAKIALTSDEPFRRGDRRAVPEAPGAALPGAEGDSISCGRSGTSPSRSSGWAAGSRAGPTARRRSGSCCARRRRGRPRCRPTGGTSTRCYDPDPDAAGQDVDAGAAAFLDGVDALRRAVLRHLAARGGGDGPAAAAAARGGLGGARGRRHARRRARRQPGPASSSASATTTTASSVRDAGGPAGIDAYYGTGSAHALAAGRLSYVLGLQGPSLAVDTACSSSLVAVHLACRSLRARRVRPGARGRRQPDPARPRRPSPCRKARMLAPDGRCKTFDAAADGYVRGEGCGVVVLSGCPTPLRDGDRILARRSAASARQPGRAEQRPTAPNGPAQEAVIRDALADAGVRPGGRRATSRRTAPARRSAIPIEVQALAAVLGDGPRRGASAAVGSVKTNIGHLEAAAGDRRADQGGARAASTARSRRTCTSSGRTRTSRGTRCRSSIPTERVPCPRAGRASPA